MTPPTSARSMQTATARLPSWRRSVARELRRGHHAACASTLTHFRAGRRTSREIAGAAATVGRGHDLHAVRRRRARVRFLPRRRSGTGQAVVVDPAFAIEQYLDGRRAARRPHRPGRSRRTRTPTTSRGTAGSPSSTDSGERAPGRQCRVPARPARGRRRDRARRHRAALHPHARASPGALLPRGQRPHARTRAMDRPHGRLALRRRRRAARSRGRGARGSRGSVPLAAPARRARRRRRGLPGACRRLAVREGDELEGVDDDRLRASLQPGARVRRHLALHRRVGRRSRRRARRTWSGSWR